MIKNVKICKYTEYIHLVYIKICANMIVEVSMSIASIDTSLYTTPYSSALIGSVEATPTTQQYKEQELPNVAATEETTPEVDLSNYYSNVTPADFNADTTSNVSHASQTLSNAISVAVEHGMDTQDAVNIQKAKAAYEATVHAERVKNSTFEILVK